MRLGQDSVCVGLVCFAASFLSTFQYNVLYSYQVWVVLGKTEKVKSESQKKAAIAQAEPVFPIVGIGASAGGLEAIKKLLESLSENTGLAYVVIQHLSPGQESMLTDILSRSTVMSVLQVEDGMEIEPDHVYVIPPGTTMTINNGVLKLHPRGISLKPIDEFLHSLALERKTLAIGVVLSGTGTDGTEGLQVIKAEGGITFAQDPKSAHYPDMPKSAIAAEAVYFVLPPEQIAAELSRIAANTEIIRQKMNVVDTQREGKTRTQTIFTLLNASFGVNFANYKRSTITRRITRRIVLNNIENIEKYFEYLRTHPEELQALFDDLLISVTCFFREPSTFVMLKEKVFPNFIEKKRFNQTIRVWVPGCSTGEEVYSVAMAIEEFLEEKNLADVAIQIFGTDVNGKNVEKARRGIYLKNIEDNVSASRLKRFFIAVDGNYQVVKQIRGMCIFAKQDISKDPPFSNLDLIVCRNMLIYFDAQLQERIIPTFHYGLNSSGFLVLGESESVGKFTYLFESMSKRGVLFKKKMVQPTVGMQLWPPTAYTLRESVKQPAKADSVTLLREEVDHLLIAECVPASLVLNGNLDILVFRGKVDSYISVDSGAASLNVSKIVRKELRSAVQSAVYRAKKGKKDVKETVRFEKGKHKRVVGIRVKPFKISEHEESFFLVLFEEVSKGKGLGRKSGASTGNSEAESVKDQQIKELSDDLESTKQTLQTVTEQQEAINEELSSSMEEVQSSNEELMSANEELETAKEELQSTNEELTTLNDELKNRNQSLSQLNDDLVNLMGNVDTAVVIVDNDFKIRRVSSSAQELLRLMPSDIDHPITDIRLGIPIENLEELLSMAVNLEVVRQDIQVGNGRYYQMRIRPYLTQEKRAVGLVLSFADVTEIKLLEDKLKVVSSFTRHDIKNKLMTINGNLYLAKLAKGKSEAEKYCNHIEEASTSIGRILEVSRAYEMIGNQALSPVDAGKALDEAKALFADLKGVKISNEVRSFNVMADTLLTTVFHNLIDNTLKYGEKTTNIRVYALENSDGSRSIVYEDDGVGISFEDKKKLFEKGFGKGTGLGLYLTKKAFEFYGWTIQELGEPGKGVKFVIKIPKS